MSYHRNSEFSSGPGAIAAIDGVTSLRKRIRGARARTSAKRDRALAGLTYGPMGGLARPSALGLASTVGSPMQPRRLTMTGTIGPVSPPPQFPPPTPPRFVGGSRLSVGLSRTSSGILPTPPAAGGRQAPGSGWSGSGYSGGGGSTGSGLTPGGGSVVVDPLRGGGGGGGTITGDGSSSSGGAGASSGGGGGGGDGAGVSTGPSGDGGGDLAPPDSLPPPDLSSGDSNAKKLLIAAAVGLGAWLVFVRSRD